MEPDADVAGETDGNLLVYMSMGGDDSSTARAAWEAFYRRHVGYLYAVCLRAYGPLLGGEAGAADVVAETFRQVYEHADAFDPGGPTDPGAARRRVRAWLGRVAERIVLTLLRQQGRLPTRLLDQPVWQQIAEEPPADQPAAETIGPVREALASLSEREQLVLRVTLQWYRPERTHQRLPNDVTEELARTLRTTPENLRQIRRRALKKVADHLGKHGEGRSS